MAGEIVPIDSFEHFKNTVNGHGYDVDGFAGYQCWDGLQLLWQQLNMWLSTAGTGAVYACWDESVRTSNAGSEFTLIYNLNEIKTGDVMIFNRNVGWWGEYGHGGYACNDYDGSGLINLLSQNFRNANPTTGSPFSIDRVNVAGFLGAFRYKGWNGDKPQPSRSSKSHFPWVLYARKLRQSL